MSAVNVVFGRIVPGNKR